MTFRGNTPAGARAALVITIDGLGARHLGTYGGYWPTPALDRLAAQGTVFENAVVDTPCPARGLGSLWTGRHALWTERHGTPWRPFAGPQSQGVRTMLVTDEAALVDAAGAAGFDEIVLIPTRAPTAGQSALDTECGVLMAAAAEGLADARPPFLLWIHARGLVGAWDAPYEMREALADELDPAPPRWLTPPTDATRSGSSEAPRESLSVDDPDWRLGLEQACAAQVGVIDECVGGLVDEALAAHGDGLLVAITAPRGFSLGQHGFVGVGTSSLHSHSIQVPLVVRWPRGWSMPQRVLPLTYPAGLIATLHPCFGCADAPSASQFAPLEASCDEWSRDTGLCISMAPAARAISTPAWVLIEASGRRELYLKPDDRWEVNEVSDRCADIVEELVALADQHAAELAQGRPAFRGELAESLARPLI